MLILDFSHIHPGNIQLESLEHMSPSVLATVGVLVMSSSDVGWKLMLVQWLEHRNEPDKDLLTG